jgi:DNA-binding GntR family transcriptional regulator
MQEAPYVDIVVRTSVAGMKTQMMLAEFVAAVRALEAERMGTMAQLEAPLSVSEQIANSVKQLIINGELRPGERVLETDLATRFNVSRAPVRDSLRMLHKDGFIDLIPRRGAQVHLPSAADVSNLYEIRAELFALAVRKASVAMDAQLLKLAKQGVGMLVAMGEGDSAVPADFLQARTSLATLVMIAANNPKLWDLIDVLGMQAVTHARVYETSESRRRYAQSWRRIIEAIAARDAEQGADLARQLSLDSRDVLLAAMRQDQAASAESETRPPRRGAR